MAWATMALAETGEHVLYDFSRGPGEWVIEDDGVMGGVSRGQFEIDSSGHGLFHGEVSLENNGGFSSVQCAIETVDVRAFTTACLRVKGDGKEYRFIIEADPQARHYYQARFTTSGSWQTVEIPLSGLVPMWRGDQLDLPNFPGETIALIRLMIANGKAESFQLEMERIWLR